MNDDNEAIGELERRIALFETGEALGDCLGPSRRIYGELAAYAALATLAWAVLALLARP